jgi:hypothetical protein
MTRSFALNGSIIYADHDLLFSVTGQERDVLDSGVLTKSE